MCLKNVIFMVLVYIAVYPGIKAEEEIIEPQEFEKILSDFIFQYAKDNATDVCQKPVEKYINENFTRSKLYEQLQLDKYFAENSKCENLCLTVNYKFEENEENIDFNTTVQITVDISTDTTRTSMETTVDTSIDTTPISMDTSSPILNNRNDLNETTTELSGNEENSQNVTGTAIQKKQEVEGGKKTAIIVSATVASVAATAVASYFVATWVNTLLKSGTYVFPATHNA